MPDDTRAGAALHTFIGDLRAAFELAGPPTFARLETLSEHCRDPGPTARPRDTGPRDTGPRDMGPRDTGPPGGQRVRVLPHSTTHDILSGKRDKLPPWPWVSSFLHVLRIAARENGLDPEEIGSTRDWHARYLAARTAILDAQRPPLAAPVPDPVPDAGPGPAAGDAVPQPPNEEPEPPSITPPFGATTMTRRYADAYGRTGMRLLRHAEADDGQDHGVPAYRLATLLACDNRPHEALYWLQRAARVGHRLARRLAVEWDPRTDPWPPHYWKRGEAAFEIGMDYEANGYPHAAAVFFERAADNGVHEAAYRSGLHRMQYGQTWEAMLLFNRAADAGYRPAQRELDGLLPRYHGETQQGITPFGTY
ncbi:hypothetical protein [Actinomadura terrae]|uniref:hypothetical protein n=1 Tax=Actinomadura terrae TaxID=604353 RepID=UPI001FA6F971|nr:hypothetical protein [Actinomadura terrae]